MIVKGYNLKIKSGKVRYQCQCLDKGCKQSMWHQTIRMSYLFNRLNRRTLTFALHLALSKGVGTC